LNCFTWIDFLFGDGIGIGTDYGKQTVESVLSFIISTSFRGEILQLFTYQI